jgi:hypothetical protein
MAPLLLLVLLLGGGALAWQQEPPPAGEQQQQRLLPWFQQWVQGQRQVQQQAGATAERCAVTGCTECVKGRTDACAVCGTEGYVLNRSGSCSCHEGYGSTVDAISFPSRQSWELPLNCQPPDAPRIKGMAALLTPCECKKWVQGGGVTEKSRSVT